MSVQVVWDKPSEVGYLVYESGTLLHVERLADYSDKFLPMLCARYAADRVAAELDAGGARRERAMRRVGR